MITRFMQEITGYLDEQIAKNNNKPNNHFWQRYAYRELEKLLDEVKHNAIVDSDGAIKWNSSGNYLPDDCCEKLEYVNYYFSREATACKRDKQIDESIREYKERMKNYNYSDEELSEMRAAFGEGTTVVDVITGKSLTL